MADLWTSLTPAEQNAIARQAMAGSKQNNENLNRVKEQLAQNPNLLMRFAKEAGIELDDAQLQDENERTADQSMDANVDRAMAASQNSESLQQTGGLPGNNADMETRIRQLEDQIMQGRNQADAQERDLPSSRRGIDSKIDMQAYQGRMAR